MPGFRYDSVLLIDSEGSVQMVRAHLTVQYHKRYCYTTSVVNVKFFCRIYITIIPFRQNIFRNNLQRLSYQMTLFSWMIAVQNAERYSDGVQNAERLDKG
jgi:hypothetical protein